MIPFARKSHVMFTEPQTLSINAVNKDLVRVSFGDRKGVFENATEGLRLSVAHTNGKRMRKVVRIDHNKTTPDPLLADVSRQVSMSVYATVDAPNFGYTTAELDDFLEALAVYLSVAGNRTKIVNGES